MSQGGVQNLLNLLEILRIFVAAARYYMQPRARASRNIGGGTLGTFDFCVQFIVWATKPSWAENTCDSYITSGSAIFEMEQ